jgi:hypothetical protein
MPMVRTQQRLSACATYVPTHQHRYDFSLLKIFRSFNRRIQDRFFARFINCKKVYTTLLQGQKWGLKTLFSLVTCSRFCSSVAAIEVTTQPPKTICFYM